MAPQSTRSAKPLSSATRGNQPVSPVTEAAVRLISETAHDLKSPLTAVRESIRLVRDGELGPVNTEQHHCLDAADDQCGCIEQMVGEMVQLDRLRTGTPRVHRQWVSVVDVRQAVDDALRPWAGPRRIQLLWDGAEDVNARVYADFMMLRRLIVNLATNAIRASAEGSCVLIRLAQLRHGETVRWSIVDRGRGISSQEMSHIADRQVSCAGGDGLGLAISRQLAALHFSPLKLRSRLRKGTEVSFETASLGPRSVASAWARWRLGFRTIPASPGFGSTSMQSEVTNDKLRSVERMLQAGSRQIRMDAPSVSVALHHDATGPRCENRFAAGIVSLGATVSRQTADQFDVVFQSLLQMFELAYRADTRRWVWCLDGDQDGSFDRMESIRESVSARIPGIRMTWSRPQSMPLDRQRTAWQMIDLLIRKSLVPISVPHGFDADDVRLGTAPLEPSAIASARLEAELTRLTTGLRSQSCLLQGYDKHLRPERSSIR